jgi:hypothetical protein
MKDDKVYHGITNCDTTKSVNYKLTKTNLTSLSQFVISYEFKKWN